MQNKNDILWHIVDSIRQTGNDPKAQLLGYITTGDATILLGAIMPVC